MQTCPCGSGLALEKCCREILDGQRRAQTARDLLAARYTAYATADVDFLRKSLHPDKLGDFDEKSARSWAEKSQWRGLEILDVQKGGENDNEGWVEFVAHYVQRDSPVRHHEKAHFKKHEGQWFFFDGEPVPQQTVRRDSPKIGRNSPCPCGSGKKYKKCCGK